MNLWKKISNRKVKSCWDKGVKEYALMLADGVDRNIDSHEITETLLLNGADDWKQYSYDGCAWRYNSSIAETLCTKSELKRTKHGERKPNKNETWLDVQARALYQASRLILSNR